MGRLNYEFFDEFKALDNLCRDIYGKSIDNKLGVTLYLEDMYKNARLGSAKIPGWDSDYKRLKEARNLRNELAHSRNSFSSDICSQNDIEFVRSFKARILNQTDPIALLVKKVEQAKKVRTVSDSQEEDTYVPRPAIKQSTGCLSIVASFLIIVSCVIIFFL